MACTIKYLIISVLSPVPNEWSNGMKASGSQKAWGQKVDYYQPGIVFPGVRDLSKITLESSRFSTGSRIGVRDDSTPQAVEY